MASGCSKAPPLACRFEPMRRWPVGASAAPPAMPRPAMSDASAGAMPTAGMVVAGSAVSAPSGGTMPAPAMAALPSDEEGAMPLPATEQVVTAMQAPQTPD